MSPGNMFNLNLHCYYLLILENEKTESKKYIISLFIELLIPRIIVVETVSRCIIINVIIKVIITTTAIEITPFIPANYYSLLLKS